MLILLLLLAGMIIVMFVIIVIAGVNCNPGAGMFIVILLHPVRLLRVWVSEGLSQADS